MTAWIYVLGIVRVGDTAIAFHHKVVLAPDETAAYKAGSDLALQARLLPVQEGYAADSYVIELVRA